jgi:hypothetical protein
MKQAQANVRKDEGRHVRIAHLSSLDYLKDAPASAPKELLAISRQYMDLADKMLGKAKSRLNGGLIDRYLANGYGSKVDSLYYYMFNMHRFARRLDMLRLNEGVNDINRRMQLAQQKYTDQGEPIIREPSEFMLKHGPKLIGALATTGLLKI